MKTRYVRIRNQTLRALQAISAEEELSVSEVADRVLTEFINDYEWESDEDTEQNEETEDGDAEPDDDEDDGADADDNDTDE